MTEFDEIYDCLERLEEAYRSTCRDYQESLAVYEAKVRLTAAIAKVENQLARPNGNGKISAK